MKKGNGYFKRMMELLFSGSGFAGSGCITFLAYGS
jgi:hypothetical protein